MPAMKNVLFCLCITAISAQVALGASDAGPPRRLNRHRSRGPSRLDMSSLQFDAAVVEKRESIIDSAHIGVLPVLPLGTSLASQDGRVLFRRHKSQINGLDRHRRNMQDQQQQNQQQQQNGNNGKDNKNKDGKNKDGMQNDSTNTGTAGKNMTANSNGGDASSDSKRADTAGLIQIPQGQTVIIVNDNGNLKTECFEQFLAENGGGATTKTKTVTQTQTMQTYTTNSFSTSSAANIVAISSSGSVNLVPTATGIGARVVQQLFITTLNDAQKASLSAVIVAASASAASASSGGAYGGQYGASVTSSAFVTAPSPVSTGNVVFPSNGKASTTTTSQANIVAVSTRATTTTTSASVGTPAAAKSGNPSSGIGLNVVGTTKIQAAQLSSIASSATLPAQSSSFVPTSSPSASSSSATNAPASAAAQQAQADTSEVVIPGQKLSVLPIGLGVFGGLAAIALAVVGYVTYERRKYRKQFRNRRAAEAVQNALTMRQSQFAPAERY